MYLYINTEYHKYSCKILLQLKGGFDLVENTK